MSIMEQHMQWDRSKWDWDAHQMIARPAGSEGVGEERKVGSEEAGGVAQLFVPSLPSNGPSLFSSNKKGLRRAARPSTCQVDGCGKDLASEKAYLQRYCVCERHFKADSVRIQCREMRFCQQCNKFQDLPEFEGARRSCAARSKDRNMRRRQHSQRAKPEKNAGNSAGGGGATSDEVMQSATSGHNQSDDSKVRSDSQQGPSPNATWHRCGSGAESISRVQASAAATAPSNGGPTWRRSGSGTDCLERVALATAPGVVWNRSNSGAESVERLGHGLPWHPSVAGAGSGTSGAAGADASLESPLLMARQQQQQQYLGQQQQVGGGGSPGRQQQWAPAPSAMPAPAASPVEQPFGPLQGASFQGSGMAQQVGVSGRLLGQPGAGGAGMDLDLAHDLGLDPLMDLDLMALQEGSHTSGSLAASQLGPASGSSMCAPGSNVSAGRPSANSSWGSGQFAAQAAMRAAGGAARLNGGSGSMPMRSLPPLLQAQQQFAGAGGGVVAPVPSGMPGLPASLAAMGSSGDAAPLPPFDFNSLNGRRGGGGGGGTSYGDPHGRSQRFGQQQQQQQQQLQQLQQRQQLQQQQQFQGGMMGLLQQDELLLLDDQELLDPDMCGTLEDTEDRLMLRNQQQQLLLQQQHQQLQPLQQQDLLTSHQQLRQQLLLQQQQHLGSGSGRSGHQSLMQQHPLQQASRPGGRFGRLSGGAAGAWGSGPLEQLVPPLRMGGAGGVGMDSGLGGFGGCGMGGPGPASLEDVGSAVVSRLCVKMLNCTPGDLPQDMLQRLRTWAACADGELLQAFIRPGCTHLIINLRHVADLLPPGPDAELTADGQPLGAHLPAWQRVLRGGDLQEAVACFEEAFAGSGLLQGGRRFTVQVDCACPSCTRADDGAQQPAHHAAAADAAAIAGLATQHNLHAIGGAAGAGACCCGQRAFEYRAPGSEADGGSSSARWVEARELASAPRVSWVEPAAIPTGKACRAVLRGTGLVAPGVRFFARCGGKDYELRRLDGADQRAAQGEDAVVVEVPAVAAQGMLAIEASAEGSLLLGAWAPALACQDADVAQEVAAWARRAHPVSRRWLLCNLGQLMDYDGAVSALLGQHGGATASAAMASVAAAATAASPSALTADAMSSSLLLPLVRIPGVATSPLPAVVMTQAEEMNALYQLAGMGAALSAARWSDTPPAPPLSSLEMTSASVGYSRAGDESAPASGRTSGARSPLEAAVAAATAAGGLPLPFQETPHAASASATAAAQPSPRYQVQHVAAQRAVAGGADISDDTRNPQDVPRCAAAAPATAAAAGGRSQAASAGGSGTGGATAGRLLGHPLLARGCQRAAWNCGLQLFSASVRLGLPAVATGLLEWLQEQRARQGRPLSFEQLLHRAAAAGQELVTASASAATPLGPHAHHHYGGAVDGVVCDGEDDEGDDEDALDEQEGEGQHDSENEGEQEGEGRAARRSRRQQLLQQHLDPPVLSGSSFRSSSHCGSIDDDAMGGRATGAAHMLCMAVRSGCADMVLAALDWADEHGYQWPLAARGHDGETPLHAAAALRDGGEVGQLLLSLNEAVQVDWLERQDARGRTPADLADLSGNAHLTDWCLGVGADDASCHSSSSGASQSAAAGGTGGAGGAAAGGSAAGVLQGGNRPARRSSSGLSAVAEAPGEGLVPATAPVPVPEPAGKAGEQRGPPVAAQAAGVLAGWPAALLALMVLLVGLLLARQ